MNVMVVEGERHNKTKLVQMIRASELYSETSPLGKSFGMSSLPVNPTVCELDAFFHGVQSVLMAPHKNASIDQTVTVHAPWSSDGLAFPSNLARTAPVSHSKALIPRRRPVSTTVSIRSTNRLPDADCVPNDSFRQITA